MLKTADKTCKLNNLASNVTDGRKYDVRERDKGRNRWRGIREEVVREG